MSRRCPRGACQRPLFGESGMCEYHLLEARARPRRSWLRRHGKPLDTPLKATGRPREETLIAQSAA